MPAYNSYYPVRIGDQIVWLRNFRNKIGNYKATLGYADADIAAVVADADRAIYLLDTVNAAAQSFGSAITTHIDTVLTGSGADLVPLPVFALPSTPAPPANVAPGALKRIFAFIKNMKTRKGYTDDIGADLQIVGSTVADDPNAVPPADGEARSGEVVITFK